MFMLPFVNQLREATRKVYVAAAKAANKPLVTFSSAAV